MPTLEEEFIERMEAGYEAAFFGIPTLKRRLAWLYKVVNDKLATPGELYRAGRITKQEFEQARKDHIEDRYVPTPSFSETWVGGLLPLMSKYYKVSYLVAA